MLALQARGNEVPCSYQIATELEWRIHHTADDWAAVASGLARLNASLSGDGPRRQNGTGWQQPADGSWAPCSDVLWVKLAASQDGLYPYVRNDSAPPYPLSFVAQSPLRSVDTLLPHLRSLWACDVASTGRDSRTELSNTLTFVSKLVQLRDWVGRHSAALGFTIDADYAAQYDAFLDALQDPQTGYWGAQYCGIEALPLSSDDLSMTFHLSKYRATSPGGMAAAGATATVPRLLALASTTMAIRAAPYPYGWGLASDGTGGIVFDNHNSFDVATLLSLAFPALLRNGTSRAATLRASAAAALREMLAFALGPRSLEPDGSALVCAAGQSSMGDCYYFTLGLLDVAGAWNASRRFWCDEATMTGLVPDALALCRNLSAAMARMGMETGIAGSAVQILHPYC